MKRDRAQVTRRLPIPIVPSLPVAVVPARRYPTLAARSALVSRKPKYAYSRPVSQCLDPRLTAAAFGMTEGGAVHYVTGAEHTFGGTCER